LVGGPDATEFLQGQLTADVRDFGNDEGQLTAWCNPKGRVICIMTARKKGDGYRLSLPAELADHVVQRLTMFRFRSKVDFEVADATAADLAIENDFESWRLGRLRSGTPEIYGAQSEQFTSHMLNLDRLGAVSLDKGCYTGQEIISRTHYRGASKRRLQRFVSEQPVSPGDKVSSDERNIGEVVNAIGCDLLAVVPEDKMNAQLNVGGRRLSPVAG
jgi:folate-binding protein YgfZ